MWVLFHLSLTRASLDNAMEATKSRYFSAVDVAFIIRNYVTKFFSCADCKLHFGRMSLRLEQQVASDRDAVLWFWTAHNKVQRVVKCIIAHTL